MNKIYNQEPLFTMVAETVTTPEACTTEVATEGPNNTILPSVIEEIFIKFCETMSDDFLRKSNGRLEAGLKLAKHSFVVATDEPGVYTVKGYRVDLNERSCTCKDSSYGHACKHRFAAWLIQQAEQYQPDPTGELLESIGTGSLISDPSHRVFAQITHDNCEIEVEVIHISEDARKAYVAALPVVNSYNQVVPQFPFPDQDNNPHRCSGIVVMMEDIHFVKHFRWNNVTSINNRHAIIPNHGNS